MAIYSLSVRSGITTSGVALWAAMAAAGNDSTVFELRYILASTTGQQSKLGVGRSSNTPVFTNPQQFQAEDYQRPAGLTQGSAVFSTAPTLPADFFRRASITSSVGSGVVWVFTRGITLNGGGPALVLWAFSNGGNTHDIDCVVDE